MIPHLAREGYIRKDTLIALGLWAMVTGRGWLVRAVRAAIRREGLTHA
jgi:hypothetical protein